MKRFNWKCKCAIRITLENRKFVAWTIAIVKQKFLVLLVAHLLYRLFNTKNRISISISMLIRSLNFRIKCYSYLCSNKIHRKFRNTSFRAQTWVQFFVYIRGKLLYKTIYDTNSYKTRSFKLIGQQLFIVNLS